ncbi:enzyme involved in methoxymalonyl-ACP biosynthesis-like [Streptomyces lincolnensis]|uniref:Enzyme involved in methoxymalonyl-ACP biosynthesis-like n=1 Tax=Streptomyces lincolnensis TaxID=1915 RepID=A0A1B1MNM1_STRLN|nr:HAD-IIIC family phosphatase [Streptomyces lincolnensis]ANS70154.1 enzyme involved in methoxymalonyl-ACP biosynthesis-like [Streptomyces lincolnensis]AXG59051.1 enzyme involved in methoxymalonyl-ACP biosynthesis-like [Streptomyces lincolnensis]QMV11643.1 HAD-IIIC family phosphatase [Streptomyces lincolnensis]
MSAGAVDHLPHAAAPAPLSLRQAAERASLSPASAEKVRLLGTAWTGQLALFFRAYAASTGHPVAVPAPAAGALDAELRSLAGEPGPVVTAVCVEDVFGELRWESSAPLDAAALQELFAGSDRRIADFATRLRDQLARHATRYVIVPPVLPPLPLPVAERSLALRLARLAGRITDALVETLAGLPHGSVLDTDRTLETLPRAAWADGIEPRTPGPVLSEEAASLIARDLVTRLRLAWQPKVLVSDLDGTLWRGILSEDGPAGVRSHAVAEDAAHRWWQRMLLCARGQGFIIGVCSKNSPNALDAFTDAALREHVGLLVPPADFAAVSTSWTPKSEQLGAMAKALDLPTDVFVLVDDNPVELAEVAATHPDITTLRFPGPGEDWSRLCRTLQDLTAVGDSPLTREDRERAHYYGLRYRSEAARAKAMSVDDFLASLDMRLELAPVGPGHATDRCLQLLNRANRFHLTGHRFDDASWLRLVDDPDTEVFTARLIDTFGDHGICAVIVTDTAKDRVRLREFAMSCRVLNRTLETAVFDWLIGRSRRPVHVTWCPTGRNDTVLEALRGHGFPTVTRAAARTDGAVTVVFDPAVDEARGKNFVEVRLSRTS